MFKTVDLNKIYTTEEVETTALNNVNFEINSGEFVSIMGPLDAANPLYSTFLAYLIILPRASFIFLIKRYQIIRKDNVRLCANQTSVSY